MGGGLGKEDKYAVFAAFSPDVGLPVLNESLQYPSFPEITTSRSQAPLLRARPFCRLHNPRVTNETLIGVPLLRGAVGARNLTRFSGRKLARCTSKSRKARE